MNIIISTFGGLLIADMEHIIQKNNEKWMLSYKTREFQSLSELYTSDCYVYPPGQPMVLGREGRHTSGRL